ncbi:hypothetical protein [Streptosporangium lutulentum]|uniref:Uncharacterized protein n=1 Tax=Streptosporangium lutulentum TaxID=1461250 RepID=A0ABT9QFD9_9ACTN|nr:hypothetical protein [Streptosporangium lutulentum]MDP9845407.1 hypothetical protein [Streptosporangium lutulentum]
MTLEVHSAIDRLGDGRADLGFAGTFAIVVCVIRSARAGFDDPAGPG